jgi:hypothetical protein
MQSSFRQVKALVPAYFRPPLPDKKSCAAVPFTHRATRRTTHDVDVELREDETPDIILMALEFMLRSRSFQLR